MTFVGEGTKGTAICAGTPFAVCAAEQSKPVVAPAEIKVTFAFVRDGQPYYYSLHVEKTRHATRGNFFRELLDLGDLAWAEAE